MIAIALLWLLAAVQEPVSESVLPNLTASRACASTVQLQNLSDVRVIVEVEAHRGTGALVPFAGLPGRTVALNPGERRSYQPRIEEDEPVGWVKVREHLPSPRASPAVAVSGSTLCRDRDGAHTAARPVAFPSRNPWFAGETAGLPGAMLTLVNLSPTTAQVSLCYGSGTLIGVPGNSAASRELRPLCSATQEVQVPAYGARQFPVEHDGNSYFSLRTRGESLILELLRPSPAAAGLFTVDSSIQFGGVVGGGR